MKTKSKCLRCNTPFKNTKWSRRGEGGLCTGCNRILQISKRMTTITPMHEVKFSDKLWDKLDRLSAQNPESAADDEV